MSAYSSSQPTKTLKSQLKVCVTFRLHDINGWTREASSQQYIRGGDTQFKK